MIIDETITEVDLKSLASGDTFSYCGEYFIVTDIKNTISKCVSVVRLIDGHYVEYSITLLVHPISLKAIKEE